MEYFLRDIDDECVAALVLLRKLIKVLTALLCTTDIFYMLERNEEVQELRRSMRCATQDCYGLVADALAQTPAWQVMLERYLGVVSAARVHKSKISEIKTRLGDEKQCGVSEALQLVQDLSFLQTEIPSEAFAWYLESGLKKLKGFWTQALTAVASDKWSDDVALLQKVGVELAICWPLNPEMVEASSTLASILVEKSGEHKMQGFLQALKVMDEATQMKELEVGELVAKADDVKREGAGARGIPLPEGSLVKVKQCWQKMTTFMGEHYEEPALLDSMLQGLQTMLPWLGGSEKRDLTLLKAFLELQKAWDPFAETPLDGWPLDMMEMELGALIRLTQEVEEAQKHSAMKAWEADEWKGLMSCCLKKIEEGKERLVNLALGYLSDEVTAIKGVACIGDDNSIWCSGLPEDAEWAIVKGKAEEKLNDVKFADLQKEILKLRQVRCRVTTENNTDRSEKRFFVFGSFWSCSRINKWGLSG